MKELQEPRTSRRRSREEANQLVMEYEKSGLTRRIFCSQHGICAATLDNYRKRRMCDSGRAQETDPTPIGATPATFFPVELVERSSLNRQIPDNAVSLYVEMISGRRICVTAGFDATTLRRLIAVLDEV